jgi:hypothetical protein
MATGLKEETNFVNVVIYFLLLVSEYHIEKRKIFLLKKKET